MNKIILVFSFLIGMSIAAFAEQASHRVQAEALRVRNLDTVEVSRSSLPAVDREEVLKELRKRRAFSSLIRLKDQETIDALFKDFREAKGKLWGTRRLLGSSCSPWLLQELGPFLHDDELLPRRWVAGGDLHSDYGYSMTCAQIMVKLIATSPEISEEVRAAAGSISGVGIYDGLNPGVLGMMREWWVVNADAVREERYHDLTPPVIDSSTPVVWGKPPKPQEDEAGATNSIARAQETCAEECEESSTSNSHWLILLLAGFAVALIVALGLGRRRSA